MRPGRPWRILVDENLPLSLARRLRERGLDALHVYELEDARPGMSDEEIAELARRNSMVIVTMDKDFGRIAVERSDPPRVVVLRIPPRSPREEWLRELEARTLQALQQLDETDSILAVAGPRGTRLRPRRSRGESNAKPRHSGAP